MACYSTKYRLSQGFTLLEVVIAIAIFAIIGLGSWQVLNQVITSKQQVEQRSVQLRQLQKAVWLIARDIRNIVDRPIRNEVEDIEPAISSLVTGFPLTLTRSGWNNPLMEPRSNLQRIAYRMEPSKDEGYQLVRIYWPVLDRAPNTEPRKQIILEQISHFEVQFIDQDGEPQFHWPVSNQGTQNQQVQQAPAIPVGILLRMETPSFGEIERLFAIRDMETPAT